MYCGNRGIHTYILTWGNEELSLTDKSKELEPSSLTKQVVEFYEDQSKAKTETIKWIFNIKQDFLALLA